MLDVKNKENKEVLSQSDNHNERKTRKWFHFTRRNKNNLTVISICNLKLSEMIIKIIIIISLSSLL